MPGGRGEVGGGEIGCPPGGPRCLESGLQPAVAAVALLQRPPPAAGPARPRLVTAGEVVAAPAHPGIQRPPGTTRRAAAGGVAAPHCGGGGPPPPRRGRPAAPPAAPPGRPPPPRPA